MTSKETRRLAAIFILDVAAYSRLMAEDEAGTLARVLDQRGRVIVPAIAEHDGRIVKLMGDGVLAEFPSVTNAVHCAMAIQTAAAAGDAGGAAPIRLRIGINLGEVIVDGDDIYGDGVNVAARLEALAEPGGIALSGAAYDQVRGKLPYAFEAWGERQVKNIPEPVDVYHLTADSALPGKPPARSRRRRRRFGWPALVAVLLVFAGAGAVWWMNGGSEIVAPAQADPLARFSPDRPSVMVLPFDDLSGPDAQTYFSDGITDSLITDLSKVSGLLVIARNTSFALRDARQDVTDVGREMGVSYVVTGSVQRADSRVRINAALTDAGSGYQLWADRFDRKTDDLFAVQDEVTELILAALEVELTSEEKRVIAMQETPSAEAYDLFMKARSASREARDENGMSRTRSMSGMSGVAYREEQATTAEFAIDAALALDPDFAAAGVQKAVQALDLSGLSLLDTPAAVAAAGDAARKTLAAGDDGPPLHSLIALDALMAGNPDAALTSARRAVLVDPNYADGYAILAWVSHFAGKPGDAGRAMEIALRLNPKAPAYYHGILAEIAFAAGDDAETIRQADMALTLDPDGQRTRLMRAAALARSGDAGAAKNDMDEVLRREPETAVGAVAPIFPFADPARTQPLLAAFRSAGLPA